MLEVKQFIYSYSGEQREIMLFLDNWLTNEFNLTSKINYKIPFYYQKSWICYINPKKSNSIEFAFTRGNELSNNQNILESKGRKQVFSVELKSIDTVVINALREVLQEAILLDKTTPYASKNYRKKK